MKLELVVVVSRSLLCLRTRRKGSSGKRVENKLKILPRQTFCERVCKDVRMMGKSSRYMPHAKSSHIKRQKSQKAV